MRNPSALPADAVSLSSRGLELSPPEHIVSVPETARRPGTDLLRAIHVIAGLDPGGGTSYSIPRLCEALAVAGARITLLSVASASGTRLGELDKGYQDCRFARDYAHIPILKRFNSSADLSD